MKDLIDKHTVGVIMIIMSIVVSLITVIIVVAVVTIAILKDGNTTTTVIAAFTTVIGFMISTAGFIIHAFINGSNPGNTTNFNQTPTIPSQVNTDASNSGSTSP